jgi:hypothetical protein
VEIYPKLSVSSVRNVFKKDIWPDIAMMAARSPTKRRAEVFLLQISFYTLPPQRV